MIILESRTLVPFLVEHKLIGAHCTCIINKVTLNVDYVIVDDTCTYMYHEEKPKYLYFDQNDSLIFAFEIPNTFLFVGQGANLRISVANNNSMAEITCDKPYYTSIIKLNDNYTDKINYNPNGQFISFKPYAHVIKAIKNLKSLATELSTSITVELGSVYWTVSVSQCCVFGATNGIVGSITSQLLEKIYDYDAEVLQQSPTSIIVRKILEDGNYYVINAPISKQVDLPDIIEKMVVKCRDVCTYELTPDVGMITGEIIKNIKKDVLTLILREGRMDLKYANNQVNLSTEPRGMDLPKGLSIQVPVKSLISVVNILEKPTSISTNGEYLCMMRDNKGLLISGIIL